MLSTDLMALSARLKAYRETGVSLSPGGLANVLAILDSAALDAVEMEQCAVSGKKNDPLARVLNFHSKMRPGRIRRVQGTPLQPEPEGAA